MYKQTEEAGAKAPDLKTIIPYVRRKTLQGTNLVFSGVVPRHVRLEKSKAYLVARSLGANVNDKICKDEENKTVRTNLNFPIFVKI